MTSPSSSERVPRRIVLLAGDENSGVAEVLAEYTPEQVSGTRLHADLRRLAAEHAPRTVAAEWLSPLGWRRFLWSSK
ncbi:MAG: hypothetical protein U0736_03595 [Gemmataceae bacterium]